MNRKTVKNKMHHKAHEESRNIFDLFSVVSVPVKGRPKPATMGALKTSHFE